MALSRNVSGYGVAGLAAQAPAQPAAPPVTRFEELRRGVGMFIGTGGTIGYLVNADGAIAVDSQFMNTADDLRGRPEGARAEGHRHAAQHAPPRRSHRRQQGLRREQDRRARQLPGVAQEGHRPSKTVDQQAYATATFTDAWTEKFGNETIEARYFGPGHTGGDAVIHFQQANVMHMGDLLFNRAHPNIDRAQGARIDNWITILDTVAKRGVERHHLHRRPRQGQRRQATPAPS